ncbi:hypothetical protein NDU88_005854 [Pleurodeles waltl]|uniref:Uncharacterized protein n=1 Tax=Pleurodeles waltl TaxID=8319 RepID=A0AAV7SN22_PLEWA|nr:hypothetical protein NDU88_005854 [Pleurodeles waltl]
MQLARFEEEIRERTQIELEHRKEQEELRKEENRDRWMDLHHLTMSQRVSKQWHIAPPTPRVLAPASPDQISHFSSAMYYWQPRRYGGVAHHSLPKQEIPTTLTGVIVAPPGSPWASASAPSNHLQGGAKHPAGDHTSQKAAHLRRLSLQGILFSTTRYLISAGLVGSSSSTPRAGSLRNCKGQRVGCTARCLIAAPDVHTCQSLRGSTKCPPGSTPQAHGPQQQPLTGLLDLSVAPAQDHSALSDPQQWTPWRQSSGRHLVWCKVGPQFATFKSCRL